MRPSLLASLFLLLCGAVAGWSVWLLVPAEFRAGIPGLHQQDYRLVRTEATAMEVTDAKWLSVPWLYADFDLTMDIELGEHTGVDLLLRQVEPRIVGQQLVPFHGRFSVLRLSTERAGPAWRTRDEALFEPRAGGVELAAGYTATVWVQARGRQLRANVAGKWLPWFTAADDYGMLTVLTNGGKAVVQSLLIRNLGQPRAWLWSRWLWISLGALVGWVLAMACAAELVRPALRVALGVALLGLVGLPAQTVASLPLQLPDPSVMASLLLLPALLALLVVGLPRVGFLALLVAAAGFVAVHSVQQATASDEARVATLFGPASGAMPSEALAQRVRGPFAVHDVGPAEHRVFLIGGQLLYNRGAPTDHLEPLLSGDLRGQLRKKVDVPCLPTVDGYSSQQWEVFTRFFGLYMPDVLVFGVPRDEAAPDANGQPRSSVADLQRTLDAAREYCAQRMIRLVLFTEHDLPAAMLDLVQKTAAAHEVPLVVAGPQEAPAGISARLAAVIAPLLQKPGEGPR